MKNVFVKLTTEIQTPKGPVMAPKWVNMSRCQEIDPALEPDWAGSILTMNIPDCFVIVKEIPDEILNQLAQINEDSATVTPKSAR